MRYPYLYFRCIPPQHVNFKLLIFRNNNRALHSQLTPRSNTCVSSWVCQAHVRTCEASSQSSLGTGFMFVLGWQSTKHSSPTVVHINPHQLTLRSLPKPLPSPVLGGATSMSWESRNANKKIPCVDVDLSMPDCGCHDLSVVDSLSPRGIAR